jgi:penicillin amidase
MYSFYYSVRKMMGELDIFVGCTYGREMSMKKTIEQLGLFLGAAAGLAGAGYYLLFRRPLPKKSGALNIKGLRAPVKVLRDEWGVPHIFAESSQDLMFAQGFVHAQDRLWQMEFNRRLVAGRLSEILGEVSVPLDRWMRIIGMRRVAEKEFDLLEETTQQLLKAYAAGVNARINQGRLPIEFNLLRFSPEPWSFTDTLSWPKMMSWTLSVNWEAEIIRAKLIERLGLEKAAELDMLDYSKTPNIIPPGINFSSIGDEALNIAERARKFTGPTAPNGIGSNNWVISGKYTTTGMPLLANDMHLGLSIPSIWYENHLEAEDIHLSGITFPGIPGIIAGHNQNVTWGFTNGFPDVQDLFMEHLRRTSDNRIQYEYKGEWLDALVITETIRVKGSEPITEEVIITRHGPVINKLSPDLAGEQPLALQWTSLEPTNIMDSLINIAKSNDCLELKEAFKNWTSPAQNTVFADIKGNIGYKLPGKIPIRAKGDGRYPVPGWTGEYEWVSYIPYDELPEMMNPPKGYIVTANNRVVDSSYPYHLSNDYCAGARAERIEELIEKFVSAKKKISVEDIQRMQFDQTSTQARKIAGVLGSLNSSDPELQIVIQRMQSWDGKLSEDSSEAAVYELFAQSLMKNLLKEKLGDLTIYYTGKGPTPILAEGSIMAERSREWLDHILDQPDSNWFNIEAGNNRDEISLKTLRETIDYLKQSFGPGIDDWTWGKLHTLTFEHPLGAVKPLDKIFNRGPYPLGGDFDTVWATGSSRYDLSKKGIVGPPFRFIADLSNLGNCLGLLAPGQSGQPGSPHYADQIQAWFSGNYHPMMCNQEIVEKKAKDILILNPTSD